MTVHLTNSRQTVAKEECNNDARSRLQQRWPKGGTIPIAPRSFLRKSGRNFSRQILVTLDGGVRRRDESVSFRRGNSPCAARRSVSDGRSHCQVDGDSHGHGMPTGTCPINR